MLFLNADKDNVILLRYYRQVCIRGLHWDWNPTGPNGNLVGAGVLNFAAGCEQTVWNTHIAGALFRLVVFSQTYSLQSQTMLTQVTSLEDIYQTSHSSIWRHTWKHTLMCGVAGDKLSCSSCGLENIFKTLIIFISNGFTCWTHTKEMYLCFSLLVTVVTDMFLCWFPSFHIQ